MSYTIEKALLLANQLGKFDTERKTLPFEFEITDDGNGNYLLVYSSHDKVFYADTWHETIEEAMSAAEEEFGIDRSEWVPPNDSLQARRP